MTKQIAQFKKQADLIAEHKELNLWTVHSGEFTYRVEVFFCGFSSHFSHGLDLGADCTCVASSFGKPCVHINKVLQTIDAKHSYLFAQFNLPVGNKMTPIFDAAKATFERLELNRFKQAA